MTAALRPSRALMKRALHKEVDRCVDSETVACFEAFKRNEHIELFEYASNRKPFARRLKTEILGYATPVRARGRKDRMSRAMLDDLATLFRLEADKAEREAEADHLHAVADELEELLLLGVA